MKNSTRRVLALLLVLCMALSLVPMTALAAADEQAEEVPAGSLEADQRVSAEPGPAGEETAAEPAASEDLPDGATLDTWKQIEGSKGTNPVDPAVDEQGRMVLKTASGNGNNLHNDNPAIFVDETMNNVLATLDGTAEKTLSFTVTPESTSSWVGFGIILFYNGETEGNAHGYYIGYPAGETDGWFVQYYGGSNAYPGFTGPVIALNQPVDFEIKWTNSAVTSLKIGDTVCTLPNNGTLQNVPNTPTAVGFKLGSKDNNTTTLRLSNVHYTGQTFPGVPTNGTSDDTWRVDQDTVMAADTNDNAYVMEQTSDGLHLKAGNSNRNGHGADRTQWPTMFVNETASEALFGANSGTGAKFVELTFKPALAAANSRFGVYLHYTDPAKGFFVGYDSDGWFWEDYGGTGATYFQGNRVAAPGANETVTLRLEWTGTSLTSATVKTAGAASATSLFPSLPREFGTTSNVTGTKLGIKCAGYSATARTEVYIQEMHYTGQRTIAGYSVSGAVTDAAGNVEGATVTLKRGQTTVKTTTTDNTGAYAFTRVPAGTNYTVTASKAHYADATTPAFEVSADVEGKDITLVPLRTVSGTVKCGETLLEGATVTLSTTPAKTATTDAQGAWSITDVPTGTYTLTATLTGYEDKVETNFAVNADVTGKTVQLVKMPVVSGTVKCGETAVPNATVTLTSGSGNTAVTYTATTNTEGVYSVSVTKDLTYTVTVEATGYAFATDPATTVQVAQADVTKDLTVTESLDNYYLLETDAMTVLVSKTFPQVVQYRMKGANAGKVMNGNTGALTQLKLNDVAVTPTVTSELDAGGKRVDYTLTVDSTNNNGTNINAVIRAHIAVDLDDVNDRQSPYKANTLGFYIDDVVYAGADTAAQNAEMLAHPIKTIEIPNHSLLSVDSTVTGGIFDGACIGGNTITNTDVHYGIAQNSTLNWTGNYFVGFLSNENVSAGLASNSEDGSGVAGSTNYPVRVTMSHDAASGVETFALDSTKWFYNYDLSASHPSGDDSHDWDAMLASENTNDNVVKNATTAIYVPTADERPFARVVVVASDQNADEKINWQDGAIAYRDTVLHIPYGSDTVADQVNLRISMNFGSMAANPFLIALDNVKRVAANTDGLGQNVLLKGYAGEGHDSNHPDYYDIGERMGGAADFNTLLAEGKKVGAYFGVHVNASELYPESDTMSDEIIRRNTDGSLHYGWNWIDQGIAFSSLYDFGTGNRADRWARFHEAMGGDEGDNLDYIYVDVWGNNTGGTEDSWMTRRLSNEINKYWRIAHEWSYSNPYSSTLQHWVSDYGYGDYTHKGQLNSNVMRFLLNQYKDSFPPDFGTFGGASNAPLLGGPSMQGFEGWQGDGEYDLSIYNTFNQMVSTKFLQHYEITNWKNAERPTKMWWWVGAESSAKTASKTIENEDGTITLQNQNQYGNWANYGGTVLWTPESQITLKSADGQHTVVVTRGLDQTPDAHYDYDLENETSETNAIYRSRVITLDGKVILKGAPATAGEDTRFPKEKATLEYLIPWYWDANGDQVAPAKEKLYYWNGNKDATQSSEWDLPAGWETLTAVTLYELSDQGRDEGTNVTVNAGKVTFTGIKPNTGYVVVKGAEGASEAPAITYGTGLHLVDPSFNLDLPNANWPAVGSGTAKRAENSEGISVLKLEGMVSVSQQMTDLVAGTNYVTYVAVDNRGDARATITITDDAGKVVATNYTDRSIAHNYVSSYYLHDNHGVEAGGSYFQNMYVFFTPEAGKTYTLTLSRAAGGTGAVYFDDIRTTTTQANNYTYDASGNLTAFTQDFEHVAQGMWPFVVGPIETVADNRQHLSELHAPYTQAGWDVKKLDDVIDGHWSIKVNGKAGAQRLVFQTIPQNFRFEPGKTYTVEFDYEMGSANSYIAVVGEGAWSSVNSCRQIALEQTLNTATTKAEYDAKTTTAKAVVGHATIQVVGAQSGQTWVGIYSKDAPTVPVTGSAADFGGYKDFILDNLSITVSEVQKGELDVLLTAATPMMQDDYNGPWDAFATARTAAQAVMTNDNATQADVDKAVADLRAAMDALTKIVVSISGTVTSGTGDAQHAVAGATVTLEDGEYMPVGLTATTDDQGRYTFESTDDVMLHVQAYKVKVQATGYNVTTVAVPELTKAAPTTDAANVSLEAEGTGVYVNDFDDKDVSMMGYLVPEDTANLPRYEAADYNGSGALKITWLAGSGEARHINNIVDKSITMANGSVSFDVTPLSNDGIRFGITFRGQEGTTLNDTARVFVGQEDEVKLWFVEYWNTNPPEGSPASSYIAPSTKQIGLNRNVTRNVRATMNGTSFAVYVDGVEIYEETMAGVPTAAGYVGFNMRTEPNTVYMIDNLRIDSDDAPPADSHTISGTVTDAANNPIAGATVTVYTANESGELTRVTSTTANANGEYATPALTAGTYTVKANANYFAESAGVSVTISDANVTQNITLALDKTELQGLYDTWHGKTDAEKAAYTTSSWAAVETALTAAKTILDKTDATRNDIAGATQTLKDAVAALKEHATYLTALETALTDGKAITAEGYTTASYQALQDAITAGEAAKTDVADKTQDEIDLAAQAIQEAINGLVPCASDFAALETAYNDNKDTQKNNYTDASWQALQDALTAAKNILDNRQDYTQAEVDAAAQAITDAVAGLAEKPAPAPGGSTGRPAPSTTTETVENPDGSTTTTVTEPDGTVTETTTQPDGAKTEKVTSPEEGTTITVTDAEGEVEVQVTVPATIPAVSEENRFVDVPKGHWADQAIHEIASLGMVKGVNEVEHVYDMTSAMTRGTIATVLYRFSHGKTGLENVFQDVAQGQWYTDGVAWAAKTGVVTGYNDGTNFGPNDVITREQMATMMARYAKLIGMDTAAEATELDAFDDGAKTSDWATNGIAWCVKAGILQGKGGNILDPKANITRAEAAVMLQRFIELIK